MNVFDKVCAIPAFLIGIVFLILGAMGLFFGCKANFTLPPILGFFPALVGWAICKSIYVAWNQDNKPDYPRNNPDAPRDFQ